MNACKFACMYILTHVCLPIHTTIPTQLWHAYATLYASVMCVTYINIQYSPSTLKIIMACICVCYVCHIYQCIHHSPKTLNIIMAHIFVDCYVCHIYQYTTQYNTLNIIMAHICLCYMPLLWVSLVCLNAILQSTTAQGYQLIQRKIAKWKS